MTVGTEDDAWQAMLAYVYGDQATDRAIRIGQGEDRIAYLVAGTVYKLGRRNGANQYDHDVLTAARTAGMPWAPPTTLYDLVDGYGDRHLVLAMPYLPDDGTDPDPALVADMRRQTGGQVDRIGGNWVSRGGRPVVLDGCTVGWDAWLPAAVVAP